MSEAEEVAQMISKVAGASDAATPSKRGNGCSAAAEAAVAATAVPKVQAQSVDLSARYWAGGRIHATKAEAARTTAAVDILESPAALSRVRRSCEPILRRNPSLKPASHAQMEHSASIEPYSSHTACMHGFSCLSVARRRVALRDT